MSFITSPGVIGFSNNQNSVAPNAAVPVSFFLATAATVNADVVIGPKGIGSILAQIPDNTAAGGNKRGFRSVDLQVIRTNALNVASGNDAVTLGSDNRASANGAVALGQQNIASGVDSFANGVSSQATAQSSIAMGSANQATAANATCIGAANSIADGIGSFVFGLNARARGVAGAEVRSNGQLATPGDAQRTRHVLRLTTLDAVATAMNSDGTVGASATNIPILSNNQVSAFRIIMSARRTDTGESWGATCQGVIKRIANAASTVLLAAAPTTVIANDAGMAGVTLAVTADAVNGGLLLTATGIAATTIHWVADVECCEAG